MQKSTVPGGDFSRYAPAGYYLALRVGFAFPLEERNELPEAWVRDYACMGMLLQDPVMKWVYQHSGAVRWGEITLPDPAGVLEMAARHGLRFGAAVSHSGNDMRGHRSFGTFARSDREFTDDELQELLALVIELHAQKAPPTNLTKAELEALRLVRDGLFMKEIAVLLGVTEGAVQQRLKNAKTKLNATTSSQAVSMASGFGLI